MAWPPTLDDLKVDLNIDDTRDDTSLQHCLDAAVQFVEEIHTDDDLSRYFLGAIRLAGRWYTRRSSPDGVVVMNEMGNSRVPSFDSDIDRLLRIGKYRKPVIG